MQAQRSVWTLLVCLFIGGGIAQAQVTTATIMGTVSDSTGAVVPGATITVRNVDTGISRTITTDAAGRYRAPQLGLGNYEVTSEAAGFQSLVRSGITLTIGREAVVDFALQVGAITEKITVTGEAPLLEATNATVGSLVNAQEMRDVPLNGRSYADLAAIQPGVISDFPMAAASPFTVVFSAGASAVRRSIGGTRPMQSSYLIDGVEISTPSNGIPVSSVMGQQLGVEAIREFTVMTNNYGAQFGRAAGGVVNAVTLSGTNEFHGSAFEFLRNYVLDARDFFLQPTQPKAPLKRNQFGAAVGGPIRKDHTFFFANYEAIRLSTGAPWNGLTLTPEARQGNITGCPTGRSSCSRAESIITGRVNVNPDVVPIINLLPPPNGNYRNAGSAELITVQPFFGGEDYGITRIDQQISEKDSLFGRLTIDRSSRTDNLEAITPVPNQEFQTGGYVIAAISETHLISPAVLNTFRIGYTRRNDHAFSTYSQGGSQFPDAPGLDPRLLVVPGIPLSSYTVPGALLYGAIGGPGIDAADIYLDNVFDYEDSLIINSGRHSITVGADVKRYQTNTLGESYKYGIFTPLTIEDFLRGRFFSILALISLRGANGQPTVGGQIAGPADVYRGWRQTYGAAYVQDDFKFRPSLTLNLGLRWEGIRPPREVNGKLATVKNPFTDKDFTRLTSSDPLFNIRNEFKGFSPRIGLAWNPFSNQKTVFRAGFGVFKEIPLAYLMGLVLEAPPYSVRYQVTNPQFPFPFANLASIGSSREPTMLAYDFKMPYTIQWTASLQQQLGETFVVKATYVGTRGIDQLAEINTNNKAAQIVNGRYFVPSDAQVPNPAWNGFRYNSPIADQIYNAGELEVEKSFKGGLQFSAAYTYARNIDDGIGAGTSKGGDGIVGAATATYNWFDLRSERGLANLNVSHNFVSSYTYELPFGSGRRWGGQWKGVLDRLAGGWTISGTNSKRSGLPVNIGMTPRQTRCLQQVCVERPDVRPGGNNNPVRSDWTPNQYFDPSNFVLQPAGFYGNVGRQTLIRPGIFTMNFSLAKDNRVGEGKNLEFRAEFFNVLNHPNFGPPAASVFRNAAGDFDPNVGRITTTSTSMRSIQFGLKLTF